MNDILLALKKELVEKYFAPNGLARLDLGDINPNDPDSVKNDNGILFAAIFYYVLDDLKLLDSKDKERFEEAVSRLEIIPGLYRRKPGDERSEAHDNYLGIAACSYLFDTKHSKDILDYGGRNGYLYNNTNPGVFLPAQLRQGGEVALYKISAGHIPAIWEFIWLMVGLLTNVFSKDVSTTQLCWLRTEVIKRAFSRWPFWQWMELTFAFVYLVWLATFHYKFDSLSGLFSKYYIVDPPRHPIRSLSKYV